MEGVKEAAADARPHPIPAPTEVEQGVSGAPAQEWEKVRELAIKQLGRFIALEPKVLEGNDPEAIHDMRVASRRLQQVLGLLYPAPLSREVRRLRRKVRRCRRVLSAPRNCDVQLGRVRKLLRRKQLSQRTAWKAVEEYLVAQRGRTFAKAVGKLSKINLAAFYVRMKGHLVGNGNSWGLDGNAEPTAEKGATERGDFYDRIHQDLARTWQAFETQVVESHGDLSLPRVHRVRIAAKRLRYLIEVIDAFNVSGSAAALTWLRKLQDHLGEWHDLEVLEEMMIEMVARPAFLHDQLEMAMGVEKLIVKSRSAKGVYLERYSKMTLEGAGFGRLKEWVNQLLASPAAFTTS